MIAASLERLIVIVYPFKCKLTKHKCTIVICVIWILGLLASAPWILLLRVELVAHPASRDFQTFNTDDNFSMVANSSETYLLFEEEDFDLRENTAELFFNFEANVNQTISILDQIIELTKHKIESKNDVKLFKTCNSKSNKYLRFYFLFLCIVQYCFPLLVLCVTYTIIAYYIYVIKSRVDLIIDNKCHNNFLSKNKKKFFFIFFFLKIFLIINFFLFKKAN